MKRLKSHSLHRTTIAAVTTVFVAVVVTVCDYRGRKRKKKRENIEKKKIILEIFSKTYFVFQKVVFETNIR